MGEHVAVLDSGGRGDALRQGMLASEHVEFVTMYGGNAGTDVEGSSENASIPDNPDDFAANLAQRDVGMLVIGPEAELIDGLADDLRERGVTVFGPSAEAAQLESSKHFGGEIAKAAGIHVPQSRRISSLSTLELQLRHHLPGTVVTKYDRPFGGKGVIVSEDRETHMREVRALVDAVGPISRENAMIISKRITGPEFSLFGVSDGSDIVFMPPAQDHKRIGEGDTGPNTGGMGAYTPLPHGLISPESVTQAQDGMRRAIEVMNERGTPYQGVLYGSFMSAEEFGGEPAFIEFNARWGDPEAQVMMQWLIEAGVDVFELHKAATTGEGLGEIHIPTAEEVGAHIITMCLASAGYPESSTKGVPIHGLDSLPEGVMVHHGGTARVDDQIVTNGGRVLYIGASGDSLAAAQQTMLSAVAAQSGDSGVYFDGMQQRRDIGWRAVTA